MSDKFSYYDFISNIVPGFYLAWALNNAFNIQNFLFGNVVTESLTLIILVYILGQIIQFISKFTIEPLIKIIYWKGTFFSNIFMIKEANLCPEIIKKRYLNIISKKFNYKKEDLKILESSKIFEKENKENRKKAEHLSYQIYRNIDHDTKDNNTAQKAHLQNNYYGLFRNLSVSSLILAIIYFAGFIFSFISSTTVNILLGIFFLLALILFFIRTKQRGELYIKGLYESLH